MYRIINAGCQQTNTAALFAEETYFQEMYGYLSLLKSVTAVFINHSEVGRLSFLRFCSDY